MSSLIRSIGTAVPAYRYDRDYARDHMTSWTTDRLTRRLLRSIHDHSGIDHRYSVLPDFLPDAAPRLFTRDEAGVVQEPTTGQRNRVFTQEASPLAIAAARDALQRAPDIDPARITHLITASCTGFSNPGWDLDLVRALGLPTSVERYHLGFMGCYAAFPALRMAHQFCHARPDASVLVVCLELCTLHLQVRPEPDQLLANALFADGAAAALVEPDGQPGTGLRMHGFHSALATEGAGEMAWSIGDRGFDIRLSTYVPEILQRNIGGALDVLLAGTGWHADDMADWAVHPGGRAILDRVQQSFHLSDARLADSREVLRSFGNMSSATVLFVLKRMLERQDATGRHPICAMAFGPGLTIETALLEWSGSSAGRAPDASPAIATTC